MKQVKKFFCLQTQIKSCVTFCLKVIDKNALKLSSLAYLEIYIDKKCFYSKQDFLAKINSLSTL